MRRLPMGSKFYFSQWKACFSWLTAKFLKFVVISHSLCYIWNVKSFILCKSPVMFSTVKLKSRYNFSQFIHLCKIGIFELWSRLYFQGVSNSHRGFGIFKCCSSCTSLFFPVYDKDRKLDFLNKSGPYF